MEGATTTPPEKLRGLGAMRQLYRTNFGRGQKSDGAQSMSAKQKDSSYIPFRYLIMIFPVEKPIGCLGGPVFFSNHEFDGP